MFTSTERYIGLTLKGRYRLERFLGEGLRGLAFLAYDSLLEGWVVVKVIKDEIEGFPVPIGEEWIDEPKKAMQVRSHPHIAAILDLGDEVMASGDEKTRIPYIVWEYIDGTSLQDMLDQGKKISVHEMMEIARQLSHTLLFLKEKKLNHGDLHPRNVMALQLPAGDVTIKLIDFGMARNVLTAKGRFDDITGVMNILNQLVDKLLAYGETRDEINMGSLFRDLIRRWSNLLPIGKLTLRELADSITALRQSLSGGGNTSHSMDPLIQPRLSMDRSNPMPDFLGRREELETIIQEARKAFAHRFTHRIIVEGDPGSGKTSALKRALRELARTSDAIVIDYEVNPSDHQKPFSSLSSLWQNLIAPADGMCRLEEILDRFPHLQLHFRTRLPGLMSYFSSDRLRGEGGLLLKELAVELKNLIIEAAKLIPVVIAFDDLHAADVETIKWLFQFKPGEAGLSLACICAFSPCELDFLPNGELHPLNMLGPDEPYSKIVQLKPMHSKDVEDAISSEFTFDDSKECAHFTKFLMDETGGEPYCVMEIIKECIDKGHITAGSRGRWRIQHDMEGFVLPSSVEAHIARRLMKLNHNEMNLVKWAAHFGPSFPADGVHAVSGMGDDLFDATMKSLNEHHHLIMSEDGVLWTFAQPAIRKCLIKGIPFTERDHGLETVTEWQIDCARRKRNFKLFGEVASNLRSLGRAKKACGFILAAARGHLNAREYEDAHQHAEAALALPMDGWSGTYRRACRKTALKAKLESAIHLARFDEALVACDNLSRLAQEMNDVELILNTSQKQALILRLKCDYPAAEEQVYATIKLSKKHGRPKLAGEALRELGTVRYLKGEFQEAVNAFLQSTQVLDELGEIHSVAKTYNNLGLVYKQMGDYAPMEESLRMAIAKYREAGDKAGERLPLANLGLFHQQVGRFDEAKRCFEDILAELAPGEHPAFEAKARLSLAQVQTSIGSTEDAASTAEKALLIFTDMNDMQGQAETMSLLGDIAIDNRQYNLAKEYHKRSLKLKEEFGSEMGICHSKLRLARVAMHEGKFEIALGLAREATERARKKGWTKLTIEGITETIRAISEKDGPNAALKVLEDSRGYEGMLGDPAIVLLDYNLTAAQAYLDNRLNSEALRHLNAFEEYYQKVLNSIHDVDVKNGFAEKMASKATLAGELRQRLAAFEAR